MIRDWLCTAIPSCYKPIMDKNLFAQFQRICYYYVRLYIGIGSFRRPKPQFRNITLAFFEQNPLDAERNSASIGLPVRSTVTNCVLFIDVHNAWVNDEIKLKIDNHKNATISCQQLFPYIRSHYPQK